MTKRSITVWTVLGLLLAVVAGVVAYKATRPAQPQEMRHHLIGEAPVACVTAEACASLMDTNAVERQNFETVLSL